MRLTVLGKSPSWTDAGGACSGYLVEQDGFRLLLDCGSGVFAKLRQVVDYGSIDAVLITHLHSDHFFDLVPFSYALNHGPAAQVRHSRPALHAPPGATRALRGMLGAWGDAHLVEGAFALREYDPTDQLTLGPVSVHFCEVPHYTRTFAVGLDAGGTRLVFGADCGPSPALEAFAQGSDLLMLEATVPEPEPGEERGHMTPGEAAALARRAGAVRLVLTHFSDELDSQRIAAEGTAGFGAAVELAGEGVVYEVKRTTPGTASAS